MEDIEYTTCVPFIDFASESAHEAEDRRPYRHREPYYPWVMQEEGEA